MAIITLSSFTHHGMAGCAYNIITLSSPSTLPSSSLDISMTGKVWKMSNQLSVTLCFVFLSIPVVHLLVLQTFTKMRLSSSLSNFQKSRNFDKFIDTKSGYKDEKVKCHNVIQLPGNWIVHILKSRVCHLFVWIKSKLSQKIH